LEFFINIILDSIQRLQKNKYQEYFLAG